MNEQEFLRLLNAVARVAKPFNDDYVEATSMSDGFANCGLDSLDMLLTGIYMCDAFAIDEEIGKTLQPKTVQEMYDFMMLHHKKMPASADEALKEIQ
jgi:hypothetical protein